MQSVDSWIMANSENFPQERLPMVRQQLENLPEDKLGVLYSLSFKDSTTTTIVSAVVGEFGVDRFMLGDIGLGVLKLLTFGGCLIWWVVDIFLVGKRAKEKNFEAFMQAVSIYCR